MRSIKKILLRACVVLAFVAALEGTVRLCIEKWNNFTVVSKSKRAELKGTIDTIYCGTSTTYYAYEPQILDEKLGTNSFNLATAAQAMMGTYYLIRETADDNPVKNVYLTLTIPILKQTSSTHEYMSALDNMRTWKWKLRYLLDAADEGLTRQAFLYSTRVENFSATTWKDIKKNIKRKLQHSRSSKRYDWRGFRSSDRVYTGGDAGVYQSDDENWYGDLGASQIDAESLEYLRKIADFCESEDIRLRLIILPNTEDFASTTGDMDNMNEVCSAIAQELGVELYNFILYKERLSLFTNEKFRDSKHMNKAGAEVFSTLLAEVVTSEHPEEYFYSSINEFQTQQE